MLMTIPREDLGLRDCEIVAYRDEIDEQRWHEIRSTGIGGSDAGKVMKLSKYGSPFTLCLEKTGRLPNFEGNEATTVGTQLEGFLRDSMLPQYLAETGVKDAEVIDPIATYRSTVDPCMIANVDGFIRHRGALKGLEIKTGSSYSLNDWTGDEVPDAYYAQVQHYMAVTGLNEWWIFGLIGNRRVLRVVPRHDAFIFTLREQCKWLWEIIQRNDPAHFPLPTGLECEDDAMPYYTQPITGGTVDLTDYEQLLVRYECLKREQGDIEQELREIKQTVQAVMRTADAAESPMFRVSRTQFVRQSVDIKALLSEHPHLKEDCITSKTVDYPRITRKKEKETV